MSQQHGAPSEDCKELFGRLSAYLDGELSPEACREIEEHLCDCPPCIEFINSFRRTVDLCRRFEPSGAPAPVSPEAKQQLLAVLRRALDSRKSPGS